MGIFGKKGKDGGSSRGRGSSDLSQILHESVLGTAIDIFRQNDIFLHRLGNDEVEYIGIVLDAADIGGLGKKSKKDEAKGSIIECINSGRIATYLSAELLEADCICIIPNATTVEAMGEFSLLMNAPYEFCRVDEDGEIVLLSKKTTYAELKELIDSDGSINDILGDNSLSDDDKSSSSSHYNLDFDKREGSDEDEDDEIPRYDDDDEIEDAPDDVNVDDDFDVPYVEDDEVPEAGEEFDDRALDEAFDEALSSDVMPEQTVPEDVVAAAVSRRFYSNDLNLEINPEAFDAQFMQGGEIPRFIDDRPSSEMNDQLNEMARAANIELERMHKQNVFHLREMYFKLCAQKYDDVYRSLDVSDADTNYGLLVQDLQNDKLRKINNIDQRIAAERAEIEERWNKMLKDAAMQAARDKQHELKERLGKQHEQELYEVERIVRAKIEDEYNDALHEIQRQRREEAATLYDMSVTEVLEEISRMYSYYSAEETQRYQELSDEMAAFTDKCRKDDANRMDIKAEDLRQTEKAERVLAEEQAKMSKFAEEQRLQRQALEDQLNEQRAGYEDQIERLKSDAANERERLQRELETLDERHNELKRQYDHQEGIIERRFEARMQELRDTNEALANAADNAADAHGKGTRLVILIAIVACIATGALGMIFGGMFMSKQYTDTQTQKIYDTYIQNNQRQTQSTETNDEPVETDEGSSKQW